MIKNIANMFARTVLSRRLWLMCAILILVAFAVVHLLGFRRDTAFLCGTFTDPNPQVAILRGLCYTLAYFAATILAPVLLLAVVVDVVLERLSGVQLRSSRAIEAGKK